MKIPPIKRAWRLLRPYRKQVRQIYICAIFNGLVNLSLPLGIQAIINYIQSGELTTSWVILVIFVLIGIAVTGSLQVLQLRIVEDIQQDIFARSSFEFAYRIPNIQLLKLDSIHAPELVNRFFDTLTIQKGLPKILIDFSLASFQIIFGLILLAVYSPFFILLGLFLVVILWLIFRITGARGLRTSLQESKYKYKLAHWLEEIARTKQSFKLYAASQLHLHETDTITSGYLESREKHFRVLLSQFRYFIAFKVLLAAGLLILGGILVFQEQMNLGQFVAAEIIIILIINSVEKVIRVIETIYDVLTALDKIGYVTDLALDTDPGHATLKADESIDVDILDIHFSYPDQKKGLFNGLSYQIPPGAKVIISGKSGTGKSSLLHLMAGTYSLDEGEILFNNIPLRNYDRSRLYEQIGVYFPTNQLFAGSLYDNIAMGRTLSDRDIQETIQLLNLHSFVALQPKGLLSPIDPEGRRLPRSIIQKLLLARILVNRPKLLLMEDPLQFIPKEEKKQIIDYIMDAARDWTVIVVADDSYWKAKSTHVVDLNP